MRIKGFARAGCVLRGGGRWKRTEGGRLLPRGHSQAVWLGCRGWWGFGLGLGLFVVVYFVRGVARVEYVLPLANCARVVAAPVAEQLRKGRFI